MKSFIKNPNPEEEEEKPDERIPDEIVYKGLKPYIPPGHPDWVQLIDCEEPLVINIGARVRAYSQRGYPRLYGKVTDRKVVRGTSLYEILFDKKPDKKPTQPVQKRSMYPEKKMPVDDKEWVVRELIEVIDKPTFFANLRTGESAWTLEHVAQGPQSSMSITMSGDEWIKINKFSSIRRVFEGITEDEYFCPLYNFIYYTDWDLQSAEAAAVRLQMWYRRYRFRQLPLHNSWSSITSSMDISESIQEAEKRKAGWAYLRRRSQYSGEFKDINDMMWEEFVDRKTLERFYWQGDDDTYSWGKPEYPDSVKQEYKVKPRLGQQILYKVPERPVEEIFIVKRVRIDDETGEEFYDIVHPEEPELRFNVMPRGLIRIPPLTGEDLMYSRLEAKWRVVIKKYREQQERRKKRELDLLLQEEMSAMHENMNEDGSPDLVNDKGIDEAQRMAKRAKAKLDRAIQETRDVEEDHLLSSGAARSKIIAEAIEKIRADPNLKLSRSDVMRIRRNLYIELEKDDMLATR
jgi:hypothetical protein